MLSCAAIIYSFSLLCNVAFQTALKFMDICAVSSLGLLLDFGFKYSCICIVVYLCISGSQIFDSRILKIR